MRGAVPCHTPVLVTQAGKQDLTSTGDVTLVGVCRVGTLTPKFSVFSQAHLPPQGALLLYFHSGISLSMPGAHAEGHSRVLMQTPAQGVDANIQNSYLVNRSVDGRGDGALSILGRTYADFPC